jgi:soluble lytic murein transglycosylase
MRKFIITAGILVVLTALLFHIDIPLTLLGPVFHKGTINAYAHQYRIDPLLVTAVIKEESKFFQHARSHQGAIGLMQLLPSTARELAQEVGLKNFKADDLEDPDINIRLGVYYLRKLLDEFEGDRVLALAAYNAGLGKVQKWYIQNPLIGVEIADIPYEETRNYVKEVENTYEWLKKIQRIKERLHPKF